MESLQASRTLPEIAETPASGLDVFHLLYRWQRFLEVSDRCNADTRRQYRNRVFDFCARTIADPDWTEGHDPVHATADDVAAYLALVTVRGAARNMAIKALRSWFTYLFEHEHITRHPMLAIKSKRLRLPHRPPNLSDEELERVFGAAEKLDPRARPAMELAYATGARVGSLAGVLPEDLHLDDPDGPWIHFRHAKNDSPYEVPLGSRGERAARRLLELVDWAPKTAPNRRPTLVGVGEGVIWRWVQDAGERAELHVWPHLFRHAFAYRVANDPRISVLTASDLMNHKDPRLIRVYAAGTDAQRKLAVQEL